jgi:hypothetical protein
MVLEKIGQIFFSKMRPLFFFLLCALPLVISSLVLFSAKAQMQELEERFLKAKRKQKSALEKKRRKELFLARYSQANPYFLDQQIESFSLLQQEVQALKSLGSNPAFPQHQSIKERILFLRDNKLSFAEENIQTTAKIKEMEEKQRHPVEMDEQDLQKILSLLENVAVGPFTPVENSPQILIKNFSLKRKETPLQTNVFEVEMDLLKREFIK